MRFFRFALVLSLGLMVGGVVSVAKEHQREADQIQRRLREASTR